MASDLTGKLEAEVEIDASPEKYIHMCTHRPHHIHTSTEKIQACDLEEGEFGTHGFKACFKYFHDGKAKISNSIVEIDPAKNSVTFIQAGGDLMEEYKKFNITNQVSPKKDGKGSIVHISLDYEKLHEGIGHPESMLKFLTGLVGDMGAHLVKET